MEQSRDDARTARLRDGGDVRIECLAIIERSGSVPERVSVEGARYEKHAILLDDAIGVMVY